MALTKKEVAKSIKTLIVMLQSLRNQQVAITLRNDTVVRGILMRVDACMNIELKDATIEIDNFYSTDNQSLDAMSLEDVSTKGDDDQLDSENDADQTRADVDMDNSSEDGQGDTHGDDDEPSDYDTQQQTAATCNDSYFLVKGSRIRHIDLPSDIDLVAGTKYEIERLRNRGKQWTKRDIVRS